MTAVEARVLGQLERGPSTIEDLRLRLGYPRREIESAVQSLRLSGEPIVDDGTNGIRLTTDPEEVRAYVKRRRRRELSVALGTRALMRTANRLADRLAQIERPSLWT